MRAAKVLGLDASLVPAFEGIIAVEQAVRANRHRLIDPPGVGVVHRPGQVRRNA